MKKKKSQAARSAERAQAVRAKTRKEEQKIEKEAEKEGRKYDGRVARAARKLVPAIYRGYKKKIREAVSAGQTTCIVDSEDWSWSAGEESKATDEEIFQAETKRRAQEIAQKKLKDDGYVLEHKSQTSSTTLGSGSDPYTVGGSGSSWLEISFSEKKKS